MGRGVVDARVGGGSTRVPHLSRRGDIPHPRGLHWGGVIDAFDAIHDFSQWDVSTYRDDAQVVKGFSAF
jgi:hypothetical protein